MNDTTDKVKKLISQLSKRDIASKAEVTFLIRASNKFRRKSQFYLLIKAQRIHGKHAQWLAPSTAFCLDSLVGLTTVSNRSSTMYLHS